MQATASKLIYGSSWIALVLTALISLMWCHIGLDKDGYAAKAFELIIAPGFSGLALLLRVIPSAIFYFRKRQRRDLISLWVWGSSFVIVLVEMVALYCGIFGGLRVA